MMRTVAMILGVVGVATVCTATFAVGLLWYRGQLTDEFVESVGALLRGEEPTASLRSEEPPIAPSAADVVDLRVRRLLDIESREREVDLLLEMVDGRAAVLKSERDAFELRAKEFERRLQELQERTESDATTLVQSVLKAQAPADAVAGLMQLDLEESVVLVGGLPDKTIVRILQQFGRSDVEVEVQRGREIFEAIARGEPRRTLLEQTALEAGAKAPTPGS